MLNTKLFLFFSSSILIRDIEHGDLKYLSRHRK